MNTRQRFSGLIGRIHQLLRKERNPVKIAERRRRGVARPPGLWNSKFASPPALVDNSGEFADVTRTPRNFPD